MEFGGHIGFVYLRLHSEWFQHTRIRLKRYILSFSMAYSELKIFFKDGVWWLFEVLTMQKYMQNWSPHTRIPLNNI